MQGEKVSIGAKIASIFFYLLGIYLIINGLWGVFIGNFVHGPPPIGSFGFFVMIFFIILGFSSLFVGWSLGKV